MKRFTALLLIFVGAAAADATLSPAERSMAQANKLIEKNARNYQAYDALALALARRARETSDVEFYKRADAALEKSFAISPGNFEGERIRVWLLLGKHEFAAALEHAKRLNQKMPDDVSVYGYLTDANAELGNYPDAERATQWMLDLRPGNVPGVTRAAYLRELFGDVDGALELMNQAYQSTSPTEVEDGAWILSQMAHLNLAIGKTAEAEKLLQRALAAFPGYHYALGNLAKVRTQQQRYEDAVTLLKQRYQAAPHAENLYDLAVALQLAGQAKEASAAFAEFEQKSLAETAKTDNSNHELVVYYTDHAHQPAKGLEVAQREFARRHDVFTLDAYAWALYANGRYPESRKQIETALAVGIRDATMLRHAGEIAWKSGDRPAAERYLRQSADLHAPGSDQARAVLAGMLQASN